MQKLEIINELRKKYANKLNPDIYSLKYCQSLTEAGVEVYFKSRINLGEMICLDSFIKTVRGSSGDLIVSVPVFNPDSDIVDNARAFIQLDEYSMVLCVENIFTNRATYEIAKKYKIDYRWIRNKKI